MAKHHEHHHHSSHDEDDQHHSSHDHPSNDHVAESAHGGSGDNHPTTSPPPSHSGGGTSSDGGGTPSGGGENHSGGEGGESHPIIDVDANLLDHSGHTTASVEINGPAPIGVDVDVNTGQVTDHLGDIGDAVSGILNGAGLEKPLLAADIDGATVVVGGNQSQFNDALIKAAIDTALDLGGGHLLGNGDGGGLLNAHDIGLLQSGALDQPLLAAHVSGPVDIGAVVGGNESDASHALITADVNSPQDAPIDVGNLLDIGQNGDIGDVLHSVGVHT